MKYLVEYGNPDINMKKSYFDTLEAADKMFKMAKRFAEKRKCTWVISMWGKDGWLMESIIVNPTKIIRGNF